ncbi:16S rRNA processing protein RimM [Marvinbryantia formatexigens DSM 14469]|uniref:Ribosome maturation factor RimM n=1 Tax=Marvinbryantia formatexigens DSM 14469 TaxID=478749 RepID=C6LCN4_9FIRM|nr:ribosome maturation factor RimM [Marvinbryantia formatexigens]EET61698.1 16S rRNA processing protein RimM [Marvinbryantia formatexigens DSM 14469]UWO24487.1 ribosome maturation factor RimM [Marvinbryantia formatexigens DSM 14469]SDF10101.1 16S rRNA processing protein RimM [Marvinbryantia formatexigens]
MEQYLQVGVVSSTHGIRGEVKVYPTTDDAARFKKLKEVFAETKHGNVPLAIEQVKFFKNMVILKFKGIDNINDVEKYRGCPLLVTRENAVKLAPGEYFLCDLIGLSVSTDTGEELGTLTEVIRTGANDVYVVKTKNEKEVLIPNTKECIIEVSLEKNTMTVHLLEGLL